MVVVGVVRHGWGVGGAISASPAQRGGLGPDLEVPSQKG